jgi:protoporphyrinogen oxidase
MKLIYYKFGEFVKTYQTNRKGTDIQIKEWFEEMSGNKVIKITKAAE